VDRARYTVRIESSDAVAGAAGADAAGASGIASYEIYRARDKGSYRLYNRTTQRVLTVAGERGRTYRLYSIAIDAAGNRETAPETYGALVRVLKLKR